LFKIPTIFRFWTLYNERCSSKGTLRGDKKLDLIYSQSMTDLRDLGPNEKVINTIFDTYEQKIRLLELIILESNKTESHENNEKIIL